MTKRPLNRRGYALLLVMIFVVLFTAILGVAWRRLTSALRIEHASEVRKMCDRGSLQTLADAMRVLETQLRKGSTGIKLGCSDANRVSYKKQSGGNYYTIDFNRINTEGTEWSVDVAITTKLVYGDLGIDELPFPPP